ncbi:glycosyl transferase family 1 [Iodidimonas gelatinilytica]|uniref:Glycosyl transferase family 1 n=1 Tax=Iodidimonas gelatinilytica TaxID=1236966 RepID=A0A5A7N288_9PROT|nr:ABC-F family ATP-binding cassette domain-containing protein [Iodidimonas gelatinilytica]GER01480.1 glycosyl transferase family 1 [Iodidimonas gelatinilytica]
MLHIKDLTYRIGDRLLFDRATTHVTPGQKVGLIGRNGAGKSTLLGLITGTLSPEGGSIHIRPRAAFTLVGQEAPDGPRSLVEAVLDAHYEMRDLQKEAETATDPHRIADIHTRLADLEAHSATARAASILSGLGFDAEAQARPLNSFSGGWRMRVALASALFTRPDLLLLDEPTNYLDLEGVIWLESFLRTYPYTVVVVSHDRSLLNRAVTSILHLEQGRLVSYAGGYDAFENARLLRNERLAAMKSKQDAQRRHLQAFVDRFRAKANKASQAQSRLKMLERLKPIASVVEEHTVPFNFPKPSPLSPPLITLDAVSVGYQEDKPVLRNLDLRIDPDDRIALLGSNGNGKSTFAKLISKRLKPMTGKLTVPRTLKVGYFAQHQLDELRAKESPYDHMARVMPDSTETKVRTRLGSFGFSADKADRAVETLSGGEKARLLFALMAHAAPQVMILDEPTNHLDIDSREALIRALNEFDGAVILISHDRRLVEACADRLWVVENGGVHSFDGNIEDYRQKLLKARGARTDSNDKDQAANDQRKSDRRAAAQARAKLAPLKQALADAEAHMDDLTKKIARIERALNNPGLYDGSVANGAAKAAHLQQEQAKLTRDMDAAEERWLIAQEALEKVKQPKEMADK